MSEDPAPRPGGGTAAPPLVARIVAFVAIVVAGLCGGLIGYAVMDLQCSGDCGVWVGLGGFVGAVAGAVGVAVIAVLTLRAMGEWDITRDRR
ncbi:MAG: hypothetical protein S0880_09280 [Actinomycetota bacterium]|nr:hypothetical protein [Actinomycetota bacterium]